MLDSYLYVIIIFLFTFSCVVSYYCLKFSMLLLRLQDDIQDSLNELDNSIEVFNKILEKPVFFDSLEVRQCISEIRNSRNMINSIAQRLVSISSQEQQGIDSEVKSSEKENTESN